VVFLLENCTQDIYKSTHSFNKKNQGISKQGFSRSETLCMLCWWEYKEMTNSTIYIQYYNIKSFILKNLCLKCYRQIFYESTSGYRIYFTEVYWFLSNIHIFIYLIIIYLNNTILKKKIFFFNI